MSMYINKAKGLFNKYLVTAFSPNHKLNYKNRGVINFIDVGSVGGLPEPWRSNANVVKFLINFEPSESPTRGNNFMTYNTAVWEADETLPFYIYKGFNATGSSLFKQNYEYVRSNYEYLKKRGPKNLAETWFDRSALIDTIKLKCRTIDNIQRDEFPSLGFHFMKIDAQGAEYNILKGSESLLSSSCIGLHLELFTLPLYKRIMLLDGVEEYLSEFGFRMVKKFPAHGTFDSQHDCLFLKEHGDPALLSVIHRVYDINE